MIIHVLFEVERIRSGLQGQAAFSTLSIMTRGRRGIRRQTFAGNCNLTAWKLPPTLTDPRPGLPPHRHQATFSGLLCLFSQLSLQNRERETPVSRTCIDRFSLSWIEAFFYAPLPPCECFLSWSSVKHHVSHRPVNTTPAPPTVPHKLEEAQSFPEATKVKVACLVWQQAPMRWTWLMGMFPYLRCMFTDCSLNIKQAWSTKTSMSPPTCSTRVDRRPVTIRSHTGTHLGCNY
ncbi:hypothetical protein V8F06_002302 [Rhypophila decipiens]